MHRKEKIDKIKICILELVKEMGAVFDMNTADTTLYNKGNIDYMIHDSK